MDDIFKSLKAYLYDRASSPLLGAVVISSLVWNYRVVMLIFSGLSVHEKFRSIDGYLTTNLLWISPETCPALFAWVDPFVFKVINLIVIPAIIAWAYLYLYPKIAKPVYAHSLEEQRKIRDLKQAASEEQLITVKEKRSLVAEITKLENRLDTQTDQHRQQVTALTEENEEQRMTIENLSAEVSKLSSVAEKKTEEAKLAESKLEHWKALVSTVAGEGNLTGEHPPDSKLEDVLLHNKFVLHHNPARGIERSKDITFSSDGRIQEGRNQYENGWRLKNGKLELLQEDGEVHSRFFYLPASRLFVSTNEQDLPAASGQFIYSTSPE